jgi:hypothetical protein
MDDSQQSSDGFVWDECYACARPIFRHYAWSHENGTPPQDHDASPDEDSPNANA